MSSYSWGNAGYAGYGSDGSESHLHAVPGTTGADAREGLGGRIGGLSGGEAPVPADMQGLVRQVHHDVASALQTEQQNRRDRGEARLEGPAEQHYVRHLLGIAIRDLGVSRIEAGQPQLGDVVEAELHRAVIARMFGAGQLQHLLDDTTIQDIHINGADDVWVVRVDGLKEQVGPVAGSDEELIELVATLGAYAGLNARSWDAANPAIDLTLPDGSRLAGILGVSKRPAVSIRRHTAQDWTLQHLIHQQSLHPEAAAFLTAAVRARLNILIAGATGAGKTTLLRALAAEIEPRERIITIEKAFELGLDRFPDRHPDVKALEERLPNNEGAGAVSLADLVLRTLRMGPDRVIVGEVLGPEIVTMLNAMTQGNDGSLSTIHARSARDAFTRIETYAIQAAERLPAEASRMLIASGIDLVVFVERDLRSGRRRLSEIIEVDKYDEVIHANGLFALPDGAGPQDHARWTGVTPKHLTELEVAGWQMPGTGSRHGGSHGAGPDGGSGGGWS